MSQPAHPWFVEKTPCFPNSWRVSSYYYRTDNSHAHFFPSEGEARAEAHRRNQAGGEHWSQP